MKHRMSTSLGSLIALSFAAISCANGGDGTSTVAAPINARVGSGHLNARGMLDSTGNATFSATTGTLDTSSPPPGGVIQSLLLKVFDPTSGQLQNTQHFSMLDLGAWSAVLQGVPHGSPFEIQAVVRGVVSDSPTPIIIRDFVRYEPDLRIGALTGIVAPDHSGIVAPDHPAIGQLAYISTVVNEINGDLGAKTDCQLYVDGSYVQSNDLIVAAGGSTSCDFTYTFNSAGPHSVVVIAADVTPSDYNYSNNTIYQTVSIVAPDHTL